MLVKLLTSICLIFMTSVFLTIVIVERTKPPAEIELNYWVLTKSFVFVLLAWSLLLSTFDFANLLGDDK